MTFQRADGGSKERAPDHPVYRLLHDEANEWTPSSELREQLTRDALLWCDGFAYINRLDGAPRELIRLNPEAITINAGTDGGPIYARRTTKEVFNQASAQST